MNYVLLFLITSVFSVNTFALEIDEKLTLRIVNTSVTKKTILINRGIEDGLVKGDHAKFFISSGVIARAVCIKLSPTRSVWSVYRKVNNEFLREEQVMKLKITPAVKITKDESRMLVTDDSSISTKDPRDLGIPLAEGADDIDLSKPVLSNREDNFGSENSNLLKRNKEVFGMFHYSALTEKTSPDNGGSDFKNDITNISIRVGGEWYFPKEEMWYSRFSFVGMFMMDRHSIMAHHGTFLKEESSEFGFGVNMYPFQMPSKAYRIIHFLNYTFSLGSTNSTYQNGFENPSTGGTTPAGVESIDGSVLSHTFGYGLKYFTPSGFGARLELAYKLEGDQYTKNSVGTSWLKTRVGPKILIGLAYRF